jgi:hypothetical protein
MIAGILGLMPLILYQRCATVFPLHQHVEDQIYSLELIERMMDNHNEYHWPHLIWKRRKPPQFAKVPPVAKPLSAGYCFWK